MNRGRPDESAHDTMEFPMIQSLVGSNDPKEPAVEQVPPPNAPAKTGSLLDRLKQGIQKTRAGLVNAIEDSISGKKEIDVDLLEELEYALISADVGIRT